MAHIFISYVEEDQSLAEEICTALEGGGVYTCWIAFRDCEASKEYVEEIAVQIEECQLAVVLLSVHAISSKWMRREVISAIDLQKAVLPVVIDGSSLHKQMNLLLKGVHHQSLHTDPREHRVEGINKLCKAAHTRLAGDAQAQTVPASPPPPRFVNAAHKSFDELLVMMMGQPMAASVATLERDPEVSRPEGMDTVTEGYVRMQRKLEIDGTFARMQSGIAKMPEPPLPGSSAFRDPAAQPPAPSARKPKGKAKRKWWIWVLLIAVAIIVIVIAINSHPS